MLGLSRDLSVHRPPSPRAWRTARPGNRRAHMTETSVSFAGDLTDDPSSSPPSQSSPGPCFQVGVRSAGLEGVVLMRDLADRAIA